MSPSLVQHFLESSARRLPEKVALVCAGRRYTYQELDVMANRVAHALRSLGVQRGDRVGLHLDNRLEAVVGIFGVLKAGGVFVFLNRATKRDKLIYILNNCRASTVITDDRSPVGQLFSEAEPPVPSLRGGLVCGPGARAGERLLNFAEVLQGASEAPPRCENIDLDLACLIYTSGTTGEPKGVMSDHANVVFAAQSIIQYLQNRESDVVINVLPLSFDYGLYQLLMVFCFGGTLVLERTFTYPAAVLKLMETEQVTGFPGVPTIFSILLNLDLAAFDLSRLRYLTNTAAALPPSHVTAIRQKFPHATLFSMYGLTETKRTLYLPPHELDARPGSVGIPIPGTEAWLEDESGRRLPPGNVGELVVRGRHVMRGYWEAPEATAARYRAGDMPGERVCLTGDLFRQDEAGFFYFVGRKDDIIKSRGEKVAPKEVENVLYGLDGIVEAAVVGVPDPILGEAVKAFVVARNGGLTEAQILAHCKQRLEDFMVPQSIEFREALPKTESGKIKKAGLK
ncbi:MAG TPA: AMP-binding protein [Verrucomicrobiae bacterium]|nr:AMP-binding protein [Verrucomicrobiae bacterium]